MTNRLIVAEKSKVLLNQVVYPMLKKFPQAEKFALCQEIKKAFYDLIRVLVLANNVRARRTHYLEEADGHQKLLLILIDVAYQQKYITERKKHQIQLALEEIGRMIGGWMKASR